MSKRILIVGGVAGGASTAARARRIDEFAEIIMFERGPHVSFSNCCLPNHLSGMIENSDDLVLMSPEQFKNQYNIEARVNSEVIKINRDKKTITVKDLQSNKEYEEAYDKLVLSPGANPIVPKIDGYNKSHVFTVRNVIDIDKLNRYVRSGKVKDIAVIGGGFIGVEVAENLQLSDLDINVTLVEAADQIMAPFDYDMVQLLHKEMMEKGVNLIVGDAIAKVEDEHIELASGKTVPAQAVVMAIGVRPETTLAKEAGLEIGETGGIKVDHNYLTNDKDIYAVGDAIEVYNKLTHSKTRLALAGPAQRQARAAADHIYGIPHRNTGVIGSSCVKIFDMNAASTGLTEKAAQKAGIQYDFVYIIPGDIVGLMPENSQFHFKLIYEVPTGKILGAQAIGKGNASKRVDVIAAMIMMGGTLEDLKELELCYAPAFSTAKDPINHASLVALNILNGRFRQVPVTKVRELVESNAYIIDVREVDEYEEGHLINAINIPLSEIRNRISEIPKDVPVYLHCRSSQRSYNAIMALQNMGYDNLYNISGSFLGICCYEYFNDQVSGRDKIVTEYNFN
ncbi:NADPH-dependent 2,4-dienoyl-CoA reductase, sulfur reductase [Proteiniborus ethanoligenes]|uniref:NADPH-dependent 2,4-dienoyl-CoA reductase, sulfur reductase n=1 Tax=Proteiniborus ethanoligenes TaxID=415015 RepID=A0A1H3MBM7_9FIRM|nr:FAD-dependent oxidoreductase [Proteiniborus ethanoligenes]SDY73415.1 NADPH-dependent 2,4-dienoyl-CoA reductase, sulfur reductase [Proteiniborus ethanoligenes]